MGMAFGTLFAVWVCSRAFGMEVALHLIGPLGASAVLLFAVSSGALAQPWSIIGSYLCAAVVALLIARVLGRTLETACLAAGMTVILICWLRCLHPPAGGLAMSLVLADPASAALGWQELGAVMLGAAALLAFALAYNNATRTRYPKGATESPVPAFMPSTVENTGITAQDLQRALAEREQFFDVTAQELEELIQASERHARQRTLEAVFRR